MAVPPAQSSSPLILDLRHERCPMTYVKTKLFLNKCQAGDQVEIQLTDKEAIEQIPLQLKSQGHDILSTCHIAPDGYAITVAVNATHTHG